MCIACNGTGLKAKATFKKTRTNPKESCSSCSGLGIVLLNPAEEQASGGLSRGAILGLSFLGIASLATVAFFVNKKRKSKITDDEEFEQDETATDTVSRDDTSDESLELENKQQIKDFKIDMIDCPKGSFLMGHVDIPDNQPRTENIDIPFSLGKTEVTQELYQKVMGVNDSQFKGNLQNPVEMISWINAIKFCNKLSELEGLEVCYTKNSDQEFDLSCDLNKNGYRLPTEKEWEYAAKAGTQNRWAGTNERSDLKDFAWFDENATSTSHPVGQKEPNEWGFHDMSGNVKEWCWDKFDPTDADIATARVTRGGSWYSDASAVKISNRSDALPDESNGGLGFRLARSRPLNG